MMDLPSKYQLWLKSKNYSSSTIRNYLVDLNKYLNFSSSSLQESNLQKYIQSISSDPNYSRYLSSLNKFFEFALDQHLISKNPLKKLIKKKSSVKNKCINPPHLNPPLSSQNLSVSLRSTSPLNEREKSSSFFKGGWPAIAGQVGFKGFNKYLIISGLIILLSGLGFGLYSQAIKNSKKDLAYSTAAIPKTPGRQLSFQGRLTDSAGNAISSSSTIVFRLYDSLSSDIGTSLYTSDTGNSQVVVPTVDDNGIFSVIIGKTHGEAIPSSLFTEHTEVFLEITVNGETMTPRQQIATVAYALNSETLQGLPPSASGLRDTVMVLDANGHINLGETTPAIIATNDTLRLEGQGIILSASNGSGGDITINPDAGGILDLSFEMNAPAIGGFIKASADANMISGNLYYGKVLSDYSHDYNFLQFQNYNLGTAQLATRFSIGSSGDLFTTGKIAIGATSANYNLNVSGSAQITSNLNVGGTLTLPQGAQSGYLLQSDVSGNASWISATGIGGTYTATNGITLSNSQFKLGGALTEATRLNIGSTEVMYLSTSGNVGIGTTNPSARLTVLGDGSSATSDFTMLNANGTSNLEIRTGLTNLYNTFIGVGVGVSNTTGNRNTANGYTALNRNTTGSYNTANGYTALYSNTTGNYNTANGMSSLYSNTSGEYNTANGLQSLYYNTTGSNNIAMGLSSLINNTTGSYNTAIGTNVLGSGTTLNYNIALGYKSGYNLSVGSSNIFLGNDNGATGSYNNRLYIGNGQNPIIYGDLSTGSVGIGTTAPSGKLQVVGGDVFFGVGTSFGVGQTSANTDFRVDGNISFGGLIYGDGSQLTGIANAGGWIDGGANVYLSTSADNVGIGTSSPTSGYKLDVNGNLRVGSTAYFNSNVGIGTTNPQYGKLEILTNPSSTGGLTLFRGSGSTARSWITSNDIWLMHRSDVETNGIAINTSGNLGIGTTNPLYKLQVNGSGLFTTLGVGATSPNYAFNVSTNANIGTTLNVATITGIGSTALVTNLNADVLDGYHASNLPYINNTTNTTLTRSGSGPYTLGLNLGSTNTWTAPQTFSNSTYFGTTGIWKSNGNVGLGTTNPLSLLQLAGSNSIFKIGDTAGNTLFEVTDTSVTSNLPTNFTSSGDVSVAYDLNFTNDTASFIKSAAPLTIEAGENYESNNLTLKTYNAGKLIFDSANLWTDGINFGIGTTNPQATLQVSGGDVLLGSTTLPPTHISASTDLRVDGNLSIGGTLFANIDGSLSFADLTTGTNTSALMSVGAGSSLTYTSTGVINASQLQGASWASPLAIGTGTANTALFTFAGIGTGATNPLYVLNVGATASFNNIFTTGNVGIGTTNPIAPLHIYNSNPVGLIIENTTGAGSYNNQLAFRSNNAYRWQLGTDVANGGTTGNFEFYSSTGTAGTRLTIQPGGNIGIGTTNPGKTLDVNGTLRTAGHITFTSGDSYSLGAAGAEAYAVYIGSGGLIQSRVGATNYFLGSVGIGTSLPSGKFQVVGGDVFFGTTAFGAGQTSANTDFRVDGNISFGGLIYGDGSQLTGIANAGGWIDGGANVYLSTSADNVGIGTSSPTSGYKLDVNGNLRVGSTAYFNSNVGIGTTAPTYPLQISSTVGSGGMMSLLNTSGTESSISYRVSNGASGTGWVNGNYNNDFFIYSYTLGAQALTVKPTGFVGIGTTNPLYKLQVNGNVLVNAGGVFGVGATNPNYSIYTNGKLGVGSTAYFNSYVGIGTTKPNKFLEVYNNADGNNVGGMIINRSDVNKEANLQFGTANADKWWFQLDNNGTHKFNLYQDSAGFVQTWDTNGYVGIGTTNPTQKLDVSGNIKAQQIVLDNITGASYNEGLRIDGAAGTWRGVFLGGDVGSTGGTNANLWSLLRDTGNNFRITNNTSSNAVIFANTSGNVGIGTTNPTYKLHVSGNGNITTNLTVGSTLTTNDLSIGATIPVADNNIVLTQTAAGGLVQAINTSAWDKNASDDLTTSSNLLVLKGDSGTSETINVGNTLTITGGSGLTSVGSTTDTLTLNIGSSAGITVNADTIGVNAGSGLSFSGTQLILNLGSTNTWTAPQTYLNNTYLIGNVGIGTSSPAYKLELVGSNSIFKIGDTAGNTLFEVTDTSVTSNLPTNFTSSGDVSVAYDLNFTNSTASYIKANAPFYIQTEHPAANIDLTLSAANAGQVIIDDNASITGNLSVGGTISGDGSGLTNVAAAAMTFTNLLSGTNTQAIMTVGTGASLSYTGTGVINASQLQGASWASPLAIGTGTANSATLTTLNVGSTAYFASNVGIGTPTPVAKLHVLNSNITNYSGYFYTDTVGNADYSPLLVNQLSSAATDKIFRVRSASVDRLTVLGNGNVGIGTTNPTYKLQVAGGNNYFEDTTYLGATTTYFNTSGALVMGNSNISSVGALGMADNGTSEGISWEDGAIDYRIMIAGEDKSETYDTMWIDNHAGTGRLRIDGFSNGVFVNDAKFIVESGNVGIGTTNPLYKLQVNGNVLVNNGGVFGVGVTNANYSIYTNGKLGVGSTAYFANYVGIGTTNPIRQMQIVGSGQSISNLTDSGNNGGTLLISHNSNGVGAGGALALSSLNDSGTYVPQVALKSLLINGGTNGVSDLAFSTRGAVGDTALTERVRIKYNGSMGIGTSSPSGKLQVVGGDVFFGDTSTFGVGHTTANTDLHVQGNIEFDGQIFGDGSQLTGIANAGGWTDGGSNVYLTTIGDNVGIGTTAPTGKLTVVGDYPYNNGSGFRVQSSDGATRNLLYISTSSVGDYAAIQSYKDGTGAGVKNLLLNASGGNVGIGTTNPLAKLEVKSLTSVGTVNITSDAAAEKLAVFNFDDGGTREGYLTIAGTNIPGNDSIVFISDSDPTSGFAFATRNATNTDIRMVLNKDGNVGIGTTNPSARLEISNSGSESAIHIDADANNQSSLYLLSAGVSKIAFYRPNSSDDARIWGSVAGDIITFKNAAGGNVGIGTTAPGYKLDIANGGIRVQGGTNAAWGSLFLNNDPSWNVGNGTSYPTIGSIGGSSGSLVMLHNPHLPFRTDNEISGYAGKAGIRMAIDAAATTYWDAGLAGDFYHVYRNGTGEFFRIANNGNVGIGTTNPGQKLSVLGNGSISTSLSVGTTLTTNDLSIGATIPVADNNIVLTQTAAGGLVQAINTSAWDKNASDDYSSWFLQANGATTSSIGTGVTVNFVAGTNISLGKVANTITINGTAGAYTAANGLTLNSTTFELGGLLNRNTDIGFSGFNLTFSDAGSELVSFTPVSTTFNNPTNFTSSGDVSIAYDLNFTNQTASYIKSNASLYIESGEIFESNDLTLRTYNAGNLIVESANFWANGTNVGIGTTNPQGKLDLSTTSAGDIELRITGRANALNDSQTINFTDSHGSDGAIRLTHTDTTVASEDARMDFFVATNLNHNNTDGFAQAPVLSLFGGNVGIGTTNPTEKLTVENGNIIIKSGSGNDAFFYLGESATGGDYGYLKWDGTNDKIQLGTSIGSVALTLQENNNVGIGTTAPSGKLQVVGGDVFFGTTAFGAGQTSANTDFRVDGNISFGGLIYGDGSQLTGIANAGGWIDGGANVYLSTSADNVGIGTSSPTSGYKLDVNGNLRVGSTAYFNSTVGIGLATFGSSTGKLFVGTQNMDGSSAIAQFGGFVRLKQQLIIHDNSDVSKSAKLIYDTTKGLGIIANAEGSGNANVGIGTTAPLYKLQVVGSLLATTIGAGATDPNYTLYTNGKLGVGSTAYFASNVGIGTTTPVYALQVNSGLSSEPYIQAYFNSTMANGFGGIGVNGVYQSHIRFGIDGTNKWQIRAGEAAGTDALSIYSWTKGSDVMYFKNDGNVGIGTTAPIAKLDVIGDIKSYSAIGAAESVRTGINHYDTTAQAAGVGGQIVLGYKYTDAGAYTEGAIIKMYKENGVSGEYGSGLKFQVRNTGVNPSTKLVLTPSGYVGIGTTTPNSLLSVRSNSAGPYAYIAQINRLSSDTGALYLGADTSSNAIIASNNADLRIGRDVSGTFTDYLRVLNSNGYVGIGTTNPGSKLHINDSQSSDIPIVKLTNTYATTDYIQGFHAIAPNMGTNHFTGYVVGQDFSARNAGMMGFKYVGAGSTSNYLYLGGHSVNDAMVVTMGGNVGIGTTNPGYKLSVSDGQIWGSITGGTPHTNYVSADLVLGNDTQTRNGYNGTNGSHIMLQSSDKSTITALDQGQNLGQISYQDLKWTIGEDLGWGAQTIYMPGNASIGTPSPNTNLSVYGTTSADGPLTYNMNLLNTTAAGAANSGSGIAFGQNITGLGNIAGLAGIMGSKDNANSSDYASNLRFFTRVNGGSLTEQLRISSTGNVGIGTTNPTAKLTVLGDGSSATSDLTLLNADGTANLEIRTGLTNSHNIYMGVDVGVSSTSDSSENTAIGYQSFRLNNDGYYNTATGYQSLYSNIDGDSNSAYGYKSLYSNNYGRKNTAIGFESLYSNTDGIENIAMGYQTLYANTTGYGNSALGSYALERNTTGYYNSTFGYGSMDSNTTGYENTASGNSSLYRNTTGSRNVVMGVQSLYNNRTGSNNTVAGYYALGVGTTLNSNIAIGYYAGANLSVGSSNIFLGNNNGASGSYNNRLYIGNGQSPIIYGDLSTGNVGIGTTAPIAKLEINGSSYLYGGSGDANGDGSADVGDGIYIGQYLLGSSTMPPTRYAAADVNGDGRVTYLDSDLITRRSLGLITDEQEHHTLGKWIMDSTINFTYDRNVGINTASPLAKLHVVGVGFSTAAIIEGGAYILGGDGDTSGNNSFTAGDITLVMQHLAGSSTLTQAQYARADVNGDGRVDLLDKELMNQLSVSAITLDQAHHDYGKAIIDRNFTLNYEGNIGMGVGISVMPSAKLYVMGGGNSAAAVFNGNVGIGITNPGFLLEVNGTAAAAKFADRTNANYFLTPANADSTNNSLSLYKTGSIRFNFEDITNTNPVIGASSRIQNFDNGLLLAVGTGSTAAGQTVTGWNNQLFLNNNGYVGIGTTNPQARLDLGTAASSISNTSGDISIDAASNDISFNGDNLINIGNITVGGTLNANTIFQNGSPLSGGSGQWTTSGANIYFTGVGSTNTTVGIGTTNPGTSRFMVNTYDSTYASALASFWAPSTITTPTTVNGPAINLKNTSATDNNYSEILFRDANDYGVGAIISQTTSHANHAGDMLFLTRPSGGSISERMKITSTGFVGIGTTAPTNLLTVKGAGDTAWLAVHRSNTSDVQFKIVNAEAVKYISSTGTTSPTWTNIIDSRNSNLMLSSQLGGGTGGKIILDSNLVGIGTTNPSVGLHLVSTGNQAYRSLRIAYDDTYYGQFTQLGAGGFDINAQNTALTFSTLGTNKMIIEPGGDVGIGTTNPQYMLDVGGTLNAASIFQNGSPLSAGSGQWTTTGTNIYFQGVGSTLGFVGIGTTNPTARLEVTDSVAFNTAGDVEVGYNLNFSNDSVSYIRSLSPLTIEAGDANSTEDLTLRSRGYGDVVIGTNSIFKYNGRVGLNNNNPSYGIQVGTDTSNGNGAYVTNAGVWTNGSSRTFKEDYQAIDKQDLLNKVNSLEIYDYKYKGSFERGISPFAEDFYAAFHLGDSERYLAANHVAGVALVAIQAQQDQINDLSAQTAKLSADLIITETGNVAIGYNVSEDTLKSLGYDGYKNEIETAQYRLVDSANNSVNSIAQFGQIISGKIKTGLLTATNIVSDRIISQTTISKEIKTDVLSPISSTIVIDGDASISGKLKTNDLEAQTATVSTLYADQIISKDGSITDLMADKISSLREEMQRLISENQESTPSAIVTESQFWTADIASNSAQISGDMSLTNNLIVGAKLTVQGDTQLGNAFITGTFTTGEIAIKDNFIETTNTALYLQPSNTGSVHIMGDTLVIAENGEVIINGNLALNGSLTAQTASISGSLIADMMEARQASFKELTTEKMNVATGSATIIAQSGFAQLATSSAELSTNATAGTATLPAGKTEIIINNNQLTSQSMVYLTPNGSTNNQVVYIKSKFIAPEILSPEATSSATSNSNFTIALDQPLLTDVDINWWIIN